MRRAALYGRSVAMQGSPYTLIAYRREFKGDLIADILDASGGGHPDVAVFLQVAWAMAKTHCDATPPFDDWIRSFDPVSFALDDTQGVLEVIDKAVAAELFRHGKARRARRWAAKRMDALAQRFGDGARRLSAR